MDITLPPPTPPLLDDNNAPDHAGVDGGSEALDPPPRALGLVWRHRILDIFNTIFAVVVSVIVVLLLFPSSAAAALSPYSCRASIAPPPNPGQSMPIKLSSLALCAMMLNHRAANEGRAGVTNNGGDNDGAPSASCNDGKDGVASLRQQTFLCPRLPTTTGGDRH